MRKASAALFVVIAFTAASATAVPASGAAESRTAAQPRVTQKKVMVVGDSVALTLAIGIQQWGKKHAITVQNSAVLGCSLIDGNLVMNQSGTVHRKADSCHTKKDWPALLKKFRPDLVVALFGGNDVYNMSWDNGHTYAWAGKPVYDKHYLATMTNASTRLAATGAHVLWVTPPCFGYIKGDTGATPKSPWFDKRRVAALGTMLHTVATRTHKSVTDVVHTANCPVNYKTRPDGVHFSKAGANAAMPKLGPVILKALAH